MYIKFTNLQKPVEGTVSVSGNIATLSFVDKPTVKTGGFKCYLDKEMNYDISGDSYLGFTTIYRNDEETAKYNGYQLSNDGSVYVNPLYTIQFLESGGGSIEGETTQIVGEYSELVIPTPVPEENYVFSGWSPEIPSDKPITSDQTFRAVFTYVPTIEDIQEQKVVEMNMEQQRIIQEGVSVQLTDGTTEHFTLTDHDQISLMGLQTRVIAGDPLIPWHTSDQGENCKYYSTADMALITEKAMGLVTYHVTYFRDLRIYIRSLQSEEEIEAVTYGTPVPAEYQSQVLQDLLALMQ